MFFRHESVKFYWERIIGFNRRITYGRSISNKVSNISDDDYLNKIKEALQQSELIVGIDCTRSKGLTGNNMHRIVDGIQNPYEEVLSILGRWTLSPLDKEKPMYCFGFGDATTRDDSVLNLNPENEPCLGFDGALSQYRQMVQNLILADPKTFAPIIDKAIEIADMNQGKQHVLVIISDGPVYRCKSAGHAQLCRHEKNTIDAIKRARKYPLSIIFIGVGDRSRDMMRFFQKNISRPDFEKIQIVNYTEIMSNEVPQSRKEMDFTLAAMKKLPISR